ncbi:hypothetical protein O181_091482 [Austropuccinia psidii MF-1]|uniref:Nudix hydrolase domain-containing protein n=1 Tax=Austropuccinia psidii MF-1 TaxID=1389203 RepID=A0A9Q3P8Q0_9BASI|nr:hypothetical protein [Austropuccinia psidii MF-1]
MQNSDSSSIDEIDNLIEFKNFLKDWKPIFNLNQTNLILKDYFSSNSSNSNLIPKSLRNLSLDSINSLQRLIFNRTQIDRFPNYRRAAVLVGLFPSRSGHLNVLLTKRSKTMRTYAGQTALPGGKFNSKDRNLEQTARREAFEECGLSLDYQKVKKLTSLDPFLTRGNLIVTPIVFFISDLSLMPSLNQNEVDTLFSHPLKSLLGLDSSLSINHSNQNLSHSPFSRSFDHSWFSTNSPYKLFEFPSKHSPIVGFTADVLLEVATIAYGREPYFQRKAPGQLSMSHIISIALVEAPEFQTDHQAKTVQSHDILEDGDRSLIGRFIDLWPFPLSNRLFLKSLGPLSSKL